MVLLASKVKLLFIAALVPAQVRRLRIHSTRIVLERLSLLLLRLERVDLNLLLALAELVFVPEVRSHVPVLRLLGAEPGHAALVIRCRAARSVVMRALNLCLATDCTVFLGWGPRVLQVVGGRDTFHG